MDKQTFSGRTLDDALGEAARALGTEKSLVSYNVVNTAKEGGLFAKLFSRGVKIEAWVDTDQDDLEAAAREAVRAGLRQNQPQRNAGAQAKPGAPTHAKGRGAERPADDRKKRDEGRDRNAAAQSKRENAPRGPRPEPRGERESRGERGGPRGERKDSAPRGDRPTPRSEGSGVGPGSEAEVKGLDLDAPGVMDTLKEFTTTFLKSYDVDTTQVEFLRQDASEVVVQVNDKHLEDLLSQTDKLSHAFEHVFKRIAQKRHGDVSARIVLNAGAAQDARAEKLREMALSLAAQVKENGKTITLGAKSPQERRVIHLTLDGMEGVGTRSVGTGESRKLVIYSTLKEHQSQNRGEGRSHGRSDGGGRGGRGGGGGRRGGATAPSQGGGQSERAAQGPREHAREGGGPGVRSGGDAAGAGQPPRGEGSRSGRRRRGNRRRGPRDGQGGLDTQGGEAGSQATQGKERPERTSERGERDAHANPHVEAKG